MIDDFRIVAFAAAILLTIIMVGSGVCIVADVLADWLKMKRRKL